MVTKIHSRVKLEEDVFKSDFFFQFKNRSEINFLFYFINNLKPYKFPIFFVNLNDEELIFYVIFYNELVNTS